MSFRSYILRLLLPPFLALGIIYLAILLIFERHDIYVAAQERLRDHTHIIAAYLQAQEVHDFTALQEYLATRLNQNGDYLQEQIPELRIALVAPSTGENLLSWPLSFPSPSFDPQALSHSSTHPGYAYFQGDAWYDFPAEAVGIFPIMIAGASEPAQLQVRTRNPKLVYLAQTFWQQIGIIFLGLVTLGVFLSETLTQLLNPHLRRLGRELAGWQAENLKPTAFLRHSRVQEVNDLVSAAESLHETLQVAHAGYANLLDDAAINLSTQEVTEAYFQILPFKDTIQNPYFSLQIIRSYERSTHRLDFLLPISNEGVLAVSGYLKKDAAHTEQTPILDFLQLNLPKALADKQDGSCLAQKAPWLKELFRDFHCRLFSPKDNRTELFAFGPDISESAHTITWNTQEFTSMPAFSQWVNGTPVPDTWLERLERADEAEREILLQNFQLLSSKSDESALFLLKKL